MKASVFLQIYNLMESNIAIMLRYIHDTINSDAITFDKLSDNMKVVWFEHLRGLVKVNNIDSAFRVITENHRTANFGRFSRDNYKGYDISGNIDIKTINTIFNSIGINIRKRKLHETLRTIKVKRNTLAHGNESFLEVGRSVTVSDLDKYLDHTIKIYIKLFDGVYDFCATKKYLAGT